MGFVLDDAAYGIDRKPATYFAGATLDDFTFTKHA
ncbi:hypothetical protein P3T21_001869 [Paraburkholderia sp. GAS334]